MRKRNWIKVRFLIGIAAILLFLSLHVIIFNLSPFLRTSSLHHKDLIGSYLSFFVPINVISWLTLGQVGGIAILIFSCLSIVFIVLRSGVMYYNTYIFLFGICAFIGYRMFLKAMASKNRFLAKSEALEVDKNTVSSKISIKEKDIESAKNRVRRYTALRDITEDLSSTFDLERITNLITEKAFNIIGRSDRAFLFLIDESKQELSLFSSLQAGGLSTIKAKKGEIFDTWILKQRKSLIIEDIDNDFRFSSEALKDPADKEFKSVIGAPIMSERKIAGVLRMDSKAKGVYTQDDLRLLNITSDLAAVSLENSMLYKRTNELAITDGLTGLYVHRYFKERLNMELKRALSSGKKFSILMIDLDHFKDCNDRYGHTAGDIILVKIAQILKASVEGGNIVSRYGGEEFGIFLFETEKKKAVKIAEDIRKKIEESVFDLRRHQIRMTISIGISLFPDDGYLAEALLRKADENLYKAKEKGRNRVWPSFI